jgi:DNA-binding CsgD family transcriptional regulator
MVFSRAIALTGSTSRRSPKRLYFSLATVRSHLDRTRDKTGRRRRAELTRLAVELGLMSD